MSSSSCFFKLYGHHPDLHLPTLSFPTRRSSDLQLLALIVDLLNDPGYRVRDSRPFAYGHVELWIKAVFMDHIVDDPVERLVCVFSRGQIHFDRCEAVLRLPRQEKLVQKLIVIFEMMIEPAPRDLDTLGQEIGRA